MTAGLFRPLNQSKMSRCETEFVAPRDRSMEELLQQLVKNLGLDPQLAENATAKVMGMLKGQLGEELFSKITTAIPGASESAEQGLSRSAEEGAGGMLGQLASLASDALGGGAGQGIELAGLLKAAGLGTDQFAGFAQTILEFLREKLGEDTLSEILEKFPVLKTLLD